MVLNSPGTRGKTSSDAPASNSPAKRLKATANATPSSPEPNNVASDTTPGNTPKNALKGRRKSTPRGKLVRWDTTGKNSQLTGLDDTDILLLLAIQYVCNQHAIKIPFDRVAEIMTASSAQAFTEGSITQHLAKLRARRVNESKTVPPPLKRASGKAKKATQTQEYADSDYDDFAEDSSSDTESLQRFGTKRRFDELDNGLFVGCPDGNKQGITPRSFAVPRVNTVVDPCLSEPSFSQSALGKSPIPTGKQEVVFCQGAPFLQLHQDMQQSTGGSYHGSSQVPVRFSSLPEGYMPQYPPLQPTQQFQPACAEFQSPQQPINWETISQVQSAFPSQDSVRQLFPFGLPVCLFDVLFTDTDINQVNIPTAPRTFGQQPQSSGPSDESLMQGVTVNPALLDMNNINPGYVGGEIDAALNDPVDLNGLFATDETHQDASIWLNYSDQEFLNWPEANQSGLASDLGNP
ncbi:hypothetical protein N7532_003719 [Penicillium argentinense]|uniref:Uncharacterized protein n=1 Tax=Penicillium argentinense TaxID=1131581 RepID=A0A9W9FNI3_9EURO|nr:uncharacterized protein N7532_003719 [Penicillium argentinense]KAJ5103190.1 hypothetical protein N7532_003719 [Penicillium argentinense]